MGLKGFKIGLKEFQVGLKGFQVGLNGVTSLFESVSIWFGRVLSCLEEI